MKTEILAPYLARRIALHTQLLDDNVSLPAGKEGAAQAIERLGYVQIDTIAAIERAHHHTLWTRLPDHRHAHLHDLQAVDRRIFEYWGHALSFLPMADYRYSLPRMRAYEEPGYAGWTGYMHENFGQLLNPVLERIRAEGPLGTKDFDGRADKSVHAWMPKPARAALMLLNLRGEILVSERRNFQCYYDLAERVIAPGTDTSMPTEEELAAFVVRRCLDAYGVAMEKEMRQFLGGAAPEMIAREVARLVESGEVLPISVEGLNGEPYYARRELLERAARLGEMPPRVRLLSPFDSLIIQRERMKRLFSFDYTLECYLPEAKRVHGYFVLPVLFSDRLVGRLDPKADRKTKTFIVRSLKFEPGFDGFASIIPPLAQTLAAFARFNGCERIELQNISPAKLKRSLSAATKKHL
jgi:uncharacterized protein YcaQ